MNVNVVDIKIDTLSWKFRMKNNMRQYHICHCCLLKNRCAVMVAQNKDDSKMRKAHHCHGY
jgi:hypothetical protein